MADIHINQSLPILRTLGCARNARSGAALRGRQVRGPSAPPWGAEGSRNGRDRASCVAKCLYAVKSIGRSMRLMVALLALPLSAAITSVNVEGTTAQQAKITYTAPDSSACSMEVSESNTYSPLVHDVDPNIFAGANLDSRATNVSTDTSAVQIRQFIVGKRAAERATAGPNIGRWFSRSLQVSTTHYFRITCGSDTATGTFATTNIPLGNTWNDPLPADPNGGTYGEFITAGIYGWPEFISNDQTETVIDPNTGQLIRRMTMPSDGLQEPGNEPSGTHTFNTASGPAWSNPGNILGKSSPATYSGTTQDFILIQDTNQRWGNGNFGMENYKLDMLAWMSSGDGADATIQICMTVNGVSCWQNRLIDVVLTNKTGATIEIPNLIDTFPNGVMPPGGPYFDTAQTIPRDGTADVDSNGNMTWKNCHTCGNGIGSNFLPNWTAGSRITVNGSACSVSSVTNPNLMAINLATCQPSLTVPATNVVYSAMNFGVMIRKKTSSADQVNLLNASYTIRDHNSPGWQSSGAPERCDPQAKANSALQKNGYVCVFLGAQTYWVASDGTANFLGKFNPGNGGSGSDTYNSVSCSSFSRTFWSNTLTDNLNVLCSAQDVATGKQVVVNCQMVSTYQPGNLSFGECVNMTPASQGADLVQLIVNFAASSAPTYDKNKFPGCEFVAIQNNHNLVLLCNPGNQDTQGWTVIFNPTATGTAAGCVGAISAGQAGCIVAAEASWANPVHSFCAIHAIQNTGPDSDASWVGGQYLGKSQGRPGGNAYISTVTGTPLTNVPGVPAGTGGCPSGGPGCDNVVVDGEPCDPVAIAPWGGNCPKGAGDYLQDVVVGDTFQLNDGTYAILVAKTDHQHWLIQRDPAVSLKTPPVPNVLTATCHPSRRYDYYPNAAGWIWYYLNDPHSTGNPPNVAPTCDCTHPVTRTDLVSDLLNFKDASLGLGYGYANIVTPIPAFAGSPTVFSAMGPSFQGANGVAIAAEVAQNHGSRWHYTGDKFFTDARPLQGPGTNVAGGGGFIDRATNVTGNLWKFTSTGPTPSGCFGSGPSDGDNLYSIGGAALPSCGGGVITRKLQPQIAFCGNQPMTDMSSPATGDVITGDSSTAYKYCVARKAGECRAASAIGDIYSNCPYLKPRADGTFGCGSQFGDVELFNDTCIYNTGAYLNCAIQVNYDDSDPTGGRGRCLSQYPRTYRTDNPNEDVQGLPDASWMFTQGVLLEKMPPMGTPDAVARWNYVPYTLPLTPPAGLSVDNAVIQFGYAEYGLRDDFFCSSRKEACYATTSTINATVPYLFPSDGTDRTQAGLQGLACSSGCTIVIPTIPQRVLYYRIQYRDASNTVIAQTEIQTTVTP